MTVFKVLIIDDEPIIRKGIKNIVNWNAFGCEVCGEASNGLDGKEQVKKFMPEIIVTDICMPEVDGLTMINNIKEIVPDSKIIILTGYRDFEYAHQAIKLGAFDYIVKPTKIEELNGVIGRAVRELRAKSEMDAELDKMRQMYMKNLPVMREKLLYNLIYGIYTDESGTANQADMLGIEINDFILGIVESDAEQSEEKGGADVVDIQKVQESQFFQFGITSTIEEVFSEKFSVLSLALNSRRVAFILQTLKDNEQESQEGINSKCVYLQEIVKNCFGFTVSIAISTQGCGAKQLPEKLKECKDALEHKFYLGGNSVIFYDDLGAFFKYADYSELGEKQKALIEAVKAGNAEAVRESLKSMQDCINNLANADRDYIKNFYFNTITLINSIKTTLSADENRDEGALANLYKMIEKCDNVQDLNDVLVNVTNRTADQVHEFNSNNMKLLLRKAVDYIESHYSEQVTLNQIAEQLYVTTFYVSRMFKRELGINFVDYLNEIRINKAKEMLADTKYKTYEIAEAVGVSNPHYFSKLFRKYVGMTTSEYKESLNITNNVG